MSPGRTGRRAGAGRQWPARVVVLPWLALLGACATLPAPVPVQRPPLTQVQQFRVTACDAVGHENGPASLVIVQPQADGWRWLRLDGFGAPQARQVLDERGWRNDGFLPPDPAATSLFAGIGLLLVPGERRAALYPGIHAVTEGSTTKYLHDKKLHWQLRPLPTGWWLGLADGSGWCVQPLS